MIEYFEAIEILKSMGATAVPRSAKMQRRKNEALEMAINAINEVSTKKEYTTERVDRYISVNELIRKLNAWNMRLDNYIKANGARIPYYKLTDAIKSGTPLPKGHGRLIDKKEVKKMIEEAKVNSEHSKTFAENIIKFAPTIIEAYKPQESEDKE